MTRYTAILFLIYSTTSFAQANLDTLRIDSIIRNVGASNIQSPTIDKRIIQTIQAIDENINFIVQSNIAWHPKKFTVIKSGPIRIRQLVGKAEAIRIIFSDTTSKYQYYWNQVRRDTIAFLSHTIIQSHFELYYPNYQYPKLLLTINPLKFRDQFRCKHILFYSKDFDSAIDSLEKTIYPKLLPDYFQYLDANVDYFGRGEKKVKPKSIQILTITFGSNNIVYAGVDIYGSHFLLAFDASNSWNLISVKNLWIY